MGSSETTLEREQCSLHPNRAAVGHCERCGRGVCLECAVAFRGALRCERCAALELGDPEPAAPPRRRRLRLHHAALAALVAGLVATIPSWHRSGTLTSTLSAWSFNLDGWAALGCVALALSAAAMLVGVLRASTAMKVAALILATVSALAVGVALGRAPRFFSSTAAPFVALAGAVVGGVGIAFSLVRRGRP